LRNHKVCQVAIAANVAEDSNHIMHRRDLLKLIALACSSSILGCNPSNPSNPNNPSNPSNPKIPIPKKDWNILFLSVDDLNSWTGFLGGHPNALTPQMDRFAKRSLVFENAHCNVPLCNPSRCATLTGLQPYTSKIYDNYQKLRNTLPLIKTLPQHFKDNGYWAQGFGKVFHGSDWQSWNKDIAQGSNPKPIIPAPTNNIYSKTSPLWQRNFDWYALPNGPEEMDDYRLATLAEQFLSQYNKNNPFFMGFGTFLPHTPLYVPKQYFDLHPLSQVELPLILNNDFDDIPPEAFEAYGLNSRYHVPHSLVQSKGQWSQGVQAYLAATSFADDMVGKVLTALENSPYKDNTITVLWSDNGWHLGEKLHWKKNTLWSEATHVPLMISIPGYTDTGGRISDAVSLVDLMPTLFELCNITSNHKLDGTSLLPFLEQPSQPQERHAISTWNPGNHSVRYKHYRYTRYRYGGEELYDLKSDPNEWTNLALDTNYSVIKQHLKGLLPTSL